jgi:hypothetical protein
MKGFKDSTRTQYSMGGAAYAKGGTAKGAAKVAKVMGEFKRGELHSGSKEGPKVTKPAQAKAIAMSEARKAGMKAPMKKNEGGKVGKMPPLGETMKSVRRLPPELTPEQMRALEDRFAEKKRPSLGETMESVRRLPKELTPAQMRALEEGSKVRKYAEGGAVKPFNPTQALNAFSADLARRVQAGTMTKQQAQQAQSQFRNQVQLNTKAPPTRQGAEGIARDIMKSVMAPPARELPAPPKPAKGTPPDFAVKQPPMKTPMGRPEMPADFGHLPPGAPGYEQQFAQQPKQPPMRSQVSTAGMTPEQFLKFQYEQERAIHSDPSSPFHHMYFPQTQPPVQRPDMDIQPLVLPPMKMYDDRAPRKSVLPPPPMQPPMSEMPQKLPQLGGIGSSLVGIGRAPGFANPPSMMPSPPTQVQPPMPPMQPQMPMVQPHTQMQPPMQPPAKGPATPRIGYGTTDPRMQRGGRVAMSKGKR